MEAQSVTLMSSTEGADIYYTTDGSEPALENGVPVGTTVKYEGEIAVPGTAGADVTTVIKAVAVKSGMQSSVVMKFTYTVSINIPVTNHKIIVTKGIGGTVTPDGTVEVADGDSQTFTITPDEGYEIEALKVDGEVVSASNVYTFTDVTADYTLEVIFKQKSTPAPGPTPTQNPGPTPTQNPDATPTQNPDVTPTQNPDATPTQNPDVTPTQNPDATPTQNPDVTPTQNPDATPTQNPDATPTGNPDSTPQASYEINTGANSKFVINTDYNLVIRGDGEISKFTGVKVDGSLIGEENYTVDNKAGDNSTIITLKADYLKTLSIGSHTFEIVWTDGTAETTFTVAANTSGDVNTDNNAGDRNNTVQTAAPEVTNNSNQSVTADDGNTATIVAPKTGDNSQTAIWLTIILAVIVGFAGSIVVEKRRGRE